MARCWKSLPVQKAAQRALDTRNSCSLTSPSNPSDHTVCQRRLSDFMSFFKIQVVFEMNRIQKSVSHCYISQNSSREWIFGAQQPSVTLKS